MTEEEKAMKQEDQNGDDPSKAKKKKERVINVPKCPPSVSTAFLILRGAITSVTGAATVISNSNNNIATTSLLQATYLKEKNLSGKFSINLGKKLGDICELDLPDNDNDVDALYTVIEKVANKIITDNIPISCYNITKQELVDKFGEGCLDSSHKKTKGDTVLTVASIAGIVLAVPSSIPYTTTGTNIKQIILDRTQCNVIAGKKSRKADITIKFVTEVNDNEEEKEEYLATVKDASLLDDVDVSSISKAKIRCEEGKELQAAQIAAAEEEEAKKVDDDSKNATVIEQEEDEEMVVNVEEVKGKIDYNKLVDQFGSTLIDDELLEKLKAETIGKGRVDKLHRFLRRGMFFSHRDLNILLDAVAKGTPMYLYTGRGPSSESMHLGHLIPFLFTKWLQDAFDASLVIQMTDDEKFIFKGIYDEQDGDNLNYYAKLTIENAKDIIACEFNYEKTFIFSDLDYVGKMYPNIVRIWKSITTNATSNIFGFDGSANVGKIAFPAIQAAPSFATSFPTVLQANNKQTSDHLCLIPCAIDQDPYFRMTRDIAHKLVHKQHKLGGKPALIHSKFFPPLQGAKGKMSSSDENSAIFLTDTYDDIARKIKEHAFSGGQDTKIKQEQYGADLDVDVSYQWLRFFLEDDDELESIGKSYGSGQGEYWSTNKVKEKLISVLQDLVGQHQQRRSKITDDDVRKWMQERSII